MASSNPNPPERVEQRIREADTVTDADRELLLEFSKRLRRQQYATSTHRQALRNCATLAGVSDAYAADELPDATLAEALEERSAAETMVDWVNMTYDNEETNRHYRLALRMFGGLMTDGPFEDKPASIDWVPTGTSNNYDPSPDPAEMLHWEDDVLPMIDACHNTRDEALIAVAWDSGARGGELLDLRIGNISDHDYGLRISVDGKVGQRSITLIPSVPYLNRWLQEHPRRDDDTAPVWCNLRSGTVSEDSDLNAESYERGDSVSYHMCRQAVLRAADRAGVTKPVTFTNFRRSSASYLASQGINQAVLEDHHGWTRGSDVAARYVSVFSDASDRQLASAHGLDVEEDEPDPIAAINCPRCGKETPRHERFCMWCQQALEHGAVDEIETAQAKERRQLLAFAKEHPELLDRLEDIEPLIKAFGGDPDVIQTARRFVEETNE